MPAALLERQAELDLLGASCTRATAGHGATALVVGEAGIGKTSLVKGFLATLPTGSRALVGACEDLLAPRALGALRDAVRSTPGPLLEAVTSDADLETVFVSAAEELASRSRPTVLVVEDAHWADGATLDVLRYLGRRVHDLPALIIVTYRDDALGWDHPLRSLLGGLAGAEAIRLPLQCLSADAVGQLAAARDVDGDALFRLTDGNPFFVTEALASPTAAVPPTVVDAVMARVGALGPQAYTTLSQIAVVPAGLRLPLLRVLGGDAAAVAAAEQAGVLEVRGDIVGFRHELARRAVVQSLPGTQRIALNAAVVRALVAGGDDEPFRVLHHAAEAGDDETVVRYGLVAARAASRVGAHRQAASAYQQVLARGSRLDPAQRARVAEAYAWSLSNSNQPAAAARAAAQAVTEWERAGDDQRLVPALVTLSRQEWLTERPEAARASALRAVALASTHPGGYREALARLNLGGLLVVLDEEQDGVEQLRTALAACERLDERGLAALAHNYLGSAALQLGDVGGQVELEQSLEMARAAGRHDHAMRAYYNLVEGLWRLGRYEEAATWMDRAVAYSQDREFPVHAYMLTARRYRLLAMRGAWDEALAGLRDLVDGRGDPGMIGRETLPILARLLVRTGNPGATVTLRLAAEHSVRAGALEWVVPTGLAHLEQAWLTGSPEIADPHAASLWDRTDRPGMLVQRAEVMRYLRRLGRPTEPVDGGPEGFTAGLAGDWSAAADAWGRDGDPYERALELAESGEVDPTLEALDVLDSLGAAPAAKLVRLRLRALGVTRMPRRPLASTRANPAGLTDRQVEILRLVGSGLSNAEIASRLVVSTRTVDHHVSAILQKLGARTRREASRRIASLGLAGQDAAG